MKTFKSCFRVTYNKSAISYSARKMALRVGYIDVSITPDDLSDLENCSKHDIAVPMRIFRRSHSGN